MLSEKNGFREVVEMRAYSYWTSTMVSEDGKVIWEPGTYRSREYPGIRIEKAYLCGIFADLNKIDFYKWDLNAFAASARCVKVSPRSRLLRHRLFNQR